MPASAEASLAKALGIPRVGALGIMEAAEGANPLIEYVRERVQAVRVPWFEEATGGKYLEVAIGAEEKMCAVLGKKDGKDEGSKAAVETEARKRGRIWRGGEVVP
jgi:hypothetical protein